MPQSTFPTDAELDEFETNYAGPNTKQLEKLRKAFNGSDKNRNTTCLIRLQEVDLGEAPTRTLQKCETCARVMHTACSTQAQNFWMSHKHCSLCQRRGWHVYDSQATNAMRKGSDDCLMKRAARKAAWDVAVKSGFIVEGYRGLKDDGSLQCDRQLLLALGVAKEDKMLFCTKSNAVDEGEKVVVKSEGSIQKRRSARFPERRA